MARLFKIRIGKPGLNPPNAGPSGSEIQGGVPGSAPTESHGQVSRSPKSQANQQERLLGVNPPNREMPQRNREQEQFRKTDNLYLQEAQLGENPSSDDYYRLFLLYTKQNNLNITPDAPGGDSLPIPVLAWAHDRLQLNARDFKHVVPRVAEPGYGERTAEEIIQQVHSEIPKDLSSDRYVNKILNEFIEQSRHRNLEDSEYGYLAQLLRTNAELNRSRSHSENPPRSNSTNQATSRPRGEQIPDLTNPSPLIEEISPHRVYSTPPVIRGKIEAYDKLKQEILDYQALISNLYAVRNRAHKSLGTKLLLTGLELQKWSFDDPRKMTKNLKQAELKYIGILSAGLVGALYLHQPLIATNIAMAETAFNIVPLIFLSKKVNQNSTFLGPILGKSLERIGQRLQRENEKAPRTPGPRRTSQLDARENIDPEGGVLHGTSLEQLMDKPEFEGASELG